MIITIRELKLFKTLEINKRKRIIRYAIYINFDKIRTWTTRAKWVTRVIPLWMLAPLLTRKMILVTSLTQDP